MEGLQGLDLMVSNHGEALLHGHCFMIMRFQVITLHLLPSTHSDLHIRINSNSDIKVECTGEDQAQSPMPPPVDYHLSQPPHPNPPHQL